MKTNLTKIILMGAMAVLLVIPLIADARTRVDDGVGNQTGSFGYGPVGGSMGMPVVNSRQGIQDTNPNQPSVGVPSSSSSSSGPGLENKRSRLKGRNDAE